MLCCGASHAGAGRQQPLTAPAWRLQGRKTLLPLAERKTLGLDRWRQCGEVANWGPQAATAAATASGAAAAMAAEHTAEVVGSMAAAA